jgi:hypothetical protein
VERRTTSRFDRAQLCFTVQMPAVTPEVPSSIMLPIAAGGLIAAASAMTYRRRRRSGLA